MPVILVLTITLALPGYGDRTATIEQTMPSMESCQKAGLDLVAENNEARRIEFVCRAQS